MINFPKKLGGGSMSTMQICESLKPKVSEKAYLEIKKSLDLIKKTNSLLVLSESDLAETYKLKSEDDVADWYSKYILPAEGVYNHIYLDSKGLATIGKGHLINISHDIQKLDQELEQMDLTFKKCNPKVSCTKEIEHSIHDVKEDIKKAINFIKGKHKEWQGKFKKHGAHLYYDKNNNYVTIDDGTIDVLAKKDIMGKIKELKVAENKALKTMEKFPLFNTYPPSAQIALLEMGYNMGVPALAKLRKGHFAKLVRSTAWDKIAYDKPPIYRRGGVGEERNHAVKILFILADEWKKALEKEWFRNIFNRRHDMLMCKVPEKNKNMTPWLSSLMETNMSKL